VGPHAETVFDDKSKSGCLVEGAGIPVHPLEGPAQAGGRLPGKADRAEICALHCCGSPKMESDVWCFRCRNRFEQ
jgi:hypothetical protein